MTAGTSVPSPQFTSTGFVAPSSQAVLAGVIADIQAAFGNQLNLSAADTDTLTTPQGQLAVSMAAIITNTYQLFQLYTQLLDPAYSFGRYQDALARLYFLERDPAEPTTLSVVCSGLTGVTISVGALIQDTSGNLYSCTGSGSIGASGSTTLSFACNTPGPVAVPAANNVSIYKSIQGWDSVTVASGTQGVDAQSRASFEQEREDTVAGNSFGAAGSIIGAVAKVPGVTDYYGFDNANNTPVTVSGVTIAANSIYVCVAGGASLPIAQAILSKKGPGASYTGNTTVTAFDSNPLYSSPIPYTVKYQIATPLQLLFSVVIVNGPQIPSNATALIQQALIGAVTQGVLPNSATSVQGLRARIASVAYATSYVQAINALGPWAQVASILIGSANTPASSFVGSIAGTTLSVTSVVSGSLAAGQTLSDGSGIILNGTEIVSQLTGSAGGTGTYLVSAPQTVAGEPMLASTANQALVAVQANQEPQLVAPNIDVTTT